MKMTAVVLAVAAISWASDCLFLLDVDYRDVMDQQWVGQVDVYYISTDYMLASGPPSAVDGLRFASVLDPSFSRPAEYALLHLSSPGMLVQPGSIGTVLMERDGIVLVRLDEALPAFPQLDGVAHAQPLRTMVLDRPQSAPVMTRGGFDDYVADIVAAVSESGFQANIQQLQNYLSRYSSTDSYDTAALWVRDTIQGYGIDAELQYFSMGSYNCENVVAEKPGVVDPSKIFIICGHLDDTSPQQYTNAPGADDNASGSAAVVEAARIMAGYDFKYTIRFLCFGGEEQGLVGSAYYAQQASGAGDDIVGVVNLDMILYGPVPDNVFYVPYNTASTGLALALDAITDTYVPALAVGLEYNPGLTASDHASFWNQGYQAVLGIEQEVWNNPYYHQTTDILANYMAYFPFGTNCARSAIATVAYLAEPVGPTGIEEPHWNPVEGSLAITGLWPNPASSSLSLSMVIPGTGEVAVSILDISGRVVLSTEASGQSGALGTMLQLDGLSNGVYFVRASAAGLSDSRMFVVSR
jgi:hypothetical protein